MNIGIRLHDTLGKDMEESLALAKGQGFSCAHIAMQRVTPGFRMMDAPALLTKDLADATVAKLKKYDIQPAVLGCYLNLAHPDPAKLADIKARYYGHLRVAALSGASVVGTETGCPNEAYKLDGNTHTEEALQLFIRNLADVVACAEHWGVSLAIEPVWNHIVYDADRALKVIKAIQSPNLRIILDPVNLLCMENADDRGAVFADAMEKLCDHIAVVHIKDFVRRDGKLISVAAGTGEMDYHDILRFVKARKPYIQATLENTVNGNAVMSRELIERVYAEV